MEQTNSNFTIDIAINGKQRSIDVHPQETSDGAPYYSCQLDGENITELRRDADQKWLQLWGELDQDTYTKIGHAIAAQELKAP